MRQETGVPKRNAGVRLTSTELSQHIKIVEMGGYVDDQFNRLTPQRDCTGFSQMVTHPVKYLIQQGLTLVTDKNRCLPFAPSRAI